MRLHLFLSALFAAAECAAAPPAVVVQRPAQAPPVCLCRAERGPCLCGSDCKCPPVAKQAPAIVVAPIPAPMPAAPVAGQWVRVCNGNGTCRLVFVPAK